MSVQWHDRGEMEVSYTSVSSCARAGRISVAARPDDALETPCCFVHTRTGAVPHLMRDLLDKVRLLLQHSIGLTDDTFA